jgi:hypothetical protein
MVAGAPHYWRLDSNCLRQALRKVSWPESNDLKKSERPDGIMNGYLEFRELSSLDLVVQAFGKGMILLHLQAISKNRIASGHVFSVPVS